ncbi:MAG TPA: hypothetical protein VFA98_11230 [Thermoanaerobaculia bacterium]|jgi:hypothetical protein|nr:hypothetical protein [Thermoanaerobaculia bacterium]
MKIYRLMLKNALHHDEIRKLEVSREVDERRARELRRKFPVGYDVHLGFVVAAESEKRARGAAQAAVEQDPNDPDPIKWTSPEAGWWLDPETTVCEHVGEASNDATTESVILGSFRAG